MKNSEFLRIFAQANKDCGYDKYAEILENQATVEEAAEEEFWADQADDR